MHQIDDERPDTDFIHCDWHISGALSNPDAVARGQYYVVPAAPDVRFDGYDQQVGGGTNLYPVYNPIVTTHLTDLTKVTVWSTIVIDAGAGEGTVDATITVANGETVGNPAECKVRCVVYEDNIVLCCDPRGNDDWHTIARDMLPETPLTAINSGEVQNYHQVFDLSGAWNPDNLKAIVFVQRDPNKRIVNAGKTLSLYNVDLAVQDPITQKISGPAVPIEWDHVVTYTGANTDDVDVTLDKSTLPAGWNAELIYNSVTYPSSFTIPSMSTGQVANFVVRTLPNGGPGLGKVEVTVLPVSQPAESQVRELNAFSNTPAILYVDDDQGAAYDVAYKNAIAGAGYSAITHTLLSQGNPTASSMDVYDVVVWSTGASETGTIDLAQEAEIRSYLDAGGRFFLSSHGFTDERLFNALSITYLRVASHVFDVGATTGNGLAGDPIGNGLTLAMSPPFADKADRINPNSGATAWLTNQSGLPIGLRYDSGVFKTVYLAAAFEGLSTVAADPNNQASVMKRILDWFLPNAATGVSTGFGAANGRLQLAQNAPNPFDASTSLRFALPSTGRVALSIYDVSGRRVASLLDRAMDAGSHTIEWNGRDDSGRSVASGVYLVRLESAGETVTREMVRMK